MTVVNGSLLTMVFPFLAAESIKTRTKLSKATKGTLDCCKLQIVFKI